MEDQLARYGMRGVCVVWFGGEPLLQPQFLRHHSGGACARRVRVRDQHERPLSYRVGARAHLVVRVQAGDEDFLRWPGLSRLDARLRGRRARCPARHQVMRGRGFSHARADEHQPQEPRQHLASLALLDDMGVGRARVIPTTPSTRWEMNAQGQSMEWGEFFHNNWPERFARVLAPWKCLNQS